MRRFRHLAGGLACFVLVTGSLRAETPPSPLRLLPDQANLLVEVKNPRRLVEAFTTLDEFKQVQAFDVVKEFLDSTRVRRFFQLVRYFEKELGAPWPELLDRLAGGGIAVGVKFEADPSPALLVIQGTDEKLMQRFAKLGFELVEQELARQDVKERPTKGSYQGMETMRLSKDAHAALAGTALLIANSEKALQHGLDLYAGRDKKSMAERPGVGESAGLLPKETLTSLWLDMDYVRQTPQGKAFYVTPRDAFFTILSGSLVDVLGRSPYLCVGLVRDKDGFLATMRMPRGREGMGMEQALHLPPNGQPGSRPLLEPKGVFFSSSFYFDLGRVWLDRNYLFNEQQAKGIEKGDKDTAPFLAGSKLSTLLTQAGPYHRFVAVNQPKAGYQKQPKTPQPAFALVSELREPEAFSKSMESVLRGAALLAGARFNLKLVEEKYNDCPIIGYRFPEDAPLKEDVNDVRFAFSPCFTRVGNQFVACSTLELCRELVDLLQKEAKSPASGDPAPVRSRVYAAGAADSLEIGQEQLITQTILDRATTIDEARAQVKALVAMLRKMGAITFDVNYSAKELHYDLRWQTGK